MPSLEELEIKSGDIVVARYYKSCRQHIRTYRCLSTSTMGTASFHDSSGRYFSVNAEEGIGFINNEAEFFVISRQATAEEAEQYWLEVDRKQVAQDVRLASSNLTRDEITAIKNLLDGRFRPNRLLEVVAEASKIRVPN